MTEIKQKKMYIVKTEVVAPVELTFKVWAFDPEEAAAMVDRAPLASGPKLKSRGRKTRVVVYKLGYSNIEYQKRF